MYSNLYENANTHNKFSSTNSKEVPVISSIRRCLNGNKSTESIAETYSSFSSQEVIPSIDAFNWSQTDLDARPRFKDPLSGHYCLVDSGSAVTAIEAGPEDILRPDLALIAANVTLINCYGYKTIEVQTGRKVYQIKATIANIKGDVRVQN